MEWSANSGGSRIVGSRRTIWDWLLPVAIGNWDNDKTRVLVPVVDMFRCVGCGSIVLNVGTCGVCGGVVREIREDSSELKIAYRQQFRPFWTGTKTVALMLAVLVAVFSVSAGSVSYTHLTLPTICSV